MPVLVLGVALAGPAYAERPDGDNDGPDDGQEVYDGSDPRVPNGGVPANALAQPASAGHTVVFEVTGSGTTYTIDTDPAGSAMPEGTVTPFKRTMEVGPEQRLFQIIAIPKSGNLGCRITLDGR